jgi:hypothetical protein
MLCENAATTRHRSIQISKTYPFIILSGRKNLERIYTQLPCWVYEKKSCFTGDCPLEEATARLLNETVYGEEKRYRSMGIASLRGTTP